MEKQAKEVKKKNNNKVYIPMILVILTVVILGWFWYRDYSKYITTDDAYVESDNVSVSSKILGRISDEFVDEGDSVKKGMLLAVLDSTDLIAQENQTIALKEQAISTKLQTEASYKYDQENLKVLQVSLDKASEDYTRAKAQYEGKIITKETYEHATKTLETAQAQLNASTSALLVSKAKIESAASAIKSAEAQVALIETQLKNTKLYAPMDGIIAKRWLLPGDITSAGQSLFTITNNQKYWVVVYIEETKMSQLHLGQKARFTIDAFSGIDFIGKIFSIGSNTASQFSLIPPNNASGNFTKVTQRVPLKISIEGTESGEKINSLKFLAGMSAEVKIVKD
ncbi:MAG: HlyD family secretion protein [Bacteroidota bacterium]